MSAINPTNPLASTPCFDCQTKADQWLFCPTIWAGKKVKKLIPTLMTAGFTDTALIRLALIAQSIVSLITLPFKMIVAIFSGIDAMINPEDPKSWLNLVYAMTSVGSHALAVPAGFVLACLSIEVIAKGIGAGPTVSDQHVQEFATRQAMSWLSAVGLSLEDMRNIAAARS